MFPDPIHQQPEQELPRADAATCARAELDRCLPGLRAYLRRLLPPVDADDVAQDTCLEVLANPAILLRGDEPGAYLRGIARHLASRHRRRYPRHHALEDIVALAWDAYKPEDDSRERTALRACTEALGERLRRMLDLRYQQGLNASEIADRLELSHAGVRMALMRGRKALARCLGSRLDERGSP